MAITKIHPIKSTLIKALEYIEEPSKTDDKLLISTFGCSMFIKNTRPFLS